MEVTGVILFIFPEIPCLLKDRREFVEHSFPGNQRLNAFHETFLILAKGFMGETHNIAGKGIDSSEETIIEGSLIPIDGKGGFILFRVATILFHKVTEGKNVHDSNAVKDNRGWLLVIRQNKSVLFAFLPVTIELLKHIGTVRWVLHTV